MNNAVTIAIIDRIPDNVRQITSQTHQVKKPKVIETKTKITSKYIKKVRLAPIHIQLDYEKQFTIEFDEV